MTVILTVKLARLGAGEVVLNEGTCLAKKVEHGHQDTRILEEVHVYHRGTSDPVAELDERVVEAAAER